MKQADAELLRRLADAHAAIAPVLMLLIEHWNNDPTGGLPPADDLRSVGLDLLKLGRDMIVRADEVDSTVAETPSDGGDQR